MYVAGGSMLVRVRDGGLNPLRDDIGAEASDIVLGPIDPTTTMTTTTVTVARVREGRREGDLIAYGYGPPFN